MYVIAGVTGHTGSVVAETLLAQKLPVRVIVRSAEKGESWKKKGAEVAIADLTDAKALTAALKGATGAYLLVPPNFAATDLIANGKKHAEAAKVAIGESGVKHVVFLSSVGAQHAKGTGPIAALFQVENELSALKTPVTFLRAGYFMENLLGNLHPMKEQGVLPSLNDVAWPMGMVATADLGAEIVNVLRQGPNAPRIVNVAGATDVSMKDAAAIFSKRLGKTVNAVFVPADARLAALTGAGLPPVMAAAYAEMGTAVDTGLLQFEGSVRRGVISLEQFVARAAF